jgi:hypothetical protein
VNLTLGITKKKKKNSEQEYLGTGFRQYYLHVKVRKWQEAKENVQREAQKFQLILYIMWAA